MEHTILVAFTVEGDRHSAHQSLMEGLKQVGPLTSDNIFGITSWWVAEDDRQDGSDNDSAVFVHPGAQAIAVDILRGANLTADCNMTMGGNSIWEGPTPS